MEALFWISLFIIFYTFIGYGILLYGLVWLKRLRSKPSDKPAYDLPTLTLVIAAYNEAEIIEDKIMNSLALDYPEDKFTCLFVSDGSTDGTDEIISRYANIRLMHAPERSGKIKAIHRAMASIDSDLVVYTDANTFLNSEALIKIARHYADPKVGAVCGEKRVKVDQSSDATAGEGFYWRYESSLKKWDSELYSVVGAAGELFSVRTSLYEPVPADTVLDDFMISMQIAARGYRVVYEPEAYALEESSANVREELKRKIRIAAGGIQSILRINKVLDAGKYPLLTFQYISHRVLRWTITPFLLIFTFIASMSLVSADAGMVYRLLFGAQSLFYLAAATGWLLERHKLRVKALFIPYYFCVMNYAVIAGIFRYFFRGQSTLWEKAKRKKAEAAVLNE